MECTNRLEEDWLKFHLPEVLMTTLLECQKMSEFSHAVESHHLPRFRIGNGGVLKWTRL